MKKQLKTITETKDKAKEPSNTRKVKYYRGRADTGIQGAFTGWHKSLGHKLCTS